VLTLTAALHAAVANGGIFGVRVIFPDWGCVQQSSSFWTIKPYFEVFRKQELTFQSGKPLSGHYPADKPLKTINGHLERDLATSYYLTS
jgi:hypothetical protein